MSNLLCGLLVIAVWVQTDAHPADFEESFSEHNEEQPKSEEQNSYLKLESKSKGGTFALPSFYNDHMVLQQQPKRANIWGFSALVSGNITVALSGKNVTTAEIKPSGFGPGGVWVATLPAMSAGGPYTVTVYGKEGKLSLEDVLFGDVWLCSGQSNMVFTVSMMFNASEEIADAHNYPDVRLFTVAETASDEIQYDLMAVQQKWSIPNPASVGGKEWTYFSAVCWLYGKKLNENLTYPIGLISSTYGGTPIEAWSSPDSLEKCGINGTTQNSSFEYYHSSEQNEPAVNPESNTVLYNAMIHPLLNFTIYGVLWYQGENNAADPNTYNCTFPELINDWRSKFFEGTQGLTDPLFPFGFVQLAPKDQQNGSMVTGWPWIRWHQTADYGYVPNPRMEKVFMAVAMDLPDDSSPYGSVHTRDKEDVGDRLILSGLAVAYVKGGYRYQGPIPYMFFNDVEMQYIIVYFDGLTEQIEYPTRSADGFEVCCSPLRNSTCDGDDDWVAAPVVGSTLRTVFIEYKYTCHHYMLGVRYAWNIEPCDFKMCPVYSRKNSLPAPPFMKLLYLGTDYTRYRM